MPDASLRGPEGFVRVAQDLLRRSTSGLVVYFSPSEEEEPGIEAWFPGTHPFVVLGLLESLLTAVSRAQVGNVLAEGPEAEEVADDFSAVEFLTYAEAVDLLFHTEGPECLAFAGLRPMEKGDGLVAHLRLKGQPDLLASRILQLKQTLLQGPFAPYLDPATGSRVLDGKLDELPFGRESLVFAKIGVMAVHASDLLGKVIPAFGEKPD